MKITKRQLRRIIKEEKVRILEEQMGDDTVEVPLALFNELTEYLEDMSGLRMKGSGFISSRAWDLLQQVLRHTG